ncbi:MAG: hypothetical protein KIT33_15345 [Candidatus Kapabacteria bacterium]|nr:hypothetical protein [Ignavibacteriota bacterium]MCW5886344.1 hypothetical protein [Candidatus Kapabacteria bacterium]
MNVKKIVKEIDNSKKKEVSDDCVNAESMDVLLKRRTELSDALEAYMQIGFEDKISEFKLKLDQVNLLIDKQNKVKSFSLSAEAELAEERAAIIEDSIKDKKKSTVQAYKECKKPLEQGIVQLWLERIKDQTIKESDLIDIMLKEYALADTPENVTKMLNEVFKAEYEGYISNTSEIRASNHIYKVA